MSKFETMGWIVMGTTMMVAGILIIAQAIYDRWQFLNAIDPEQDQ